MINIARFISVSALESVVFYHTISVNGISVNFHIGATLNNSNHTHTNNNNNNA